jgi:signal recognition particle GTPase
LDHGSGIIIIIACGSERPARYEQLERVVEHRRVAAVGVDDREELLDVVAEQLALEQRLAGVHPVDVAAQGVDLAVVGE